MSEIAAERQEEIEPLHQAYQEAFAALMEYLDTLHPLNRTQAQTEKLSRLESICGMAKYRFETAQMKEWQSESR